MQNREEFVYRFVPQVGKRVHRLGLACNYGIDADGIAEALERGINYIFWTKFFKGTQHGAVKQALKRDRDRYVFAGGVPLGYFPRSVRRGAERLLRSFDTDYIDVFQLFWLGKMSAFTDGVREELVKLRDEGKVRAIGVSIHDRKRAGRLASESPLDLLMIRYNAAHPGAEDDIFPNLNAGGPAIVTYTATSWRKLLRRPRGWEGPVMAPGDCYRFCLSNRHVDLTLCGAANRAQMRENLEALGKGPLAPDEEAWMRAFGRRVHG